MKSSRRGAVARQSSLSAPPAGGPASLRLPPGEVELVWSAAGTLTFHGPSAQVRAAVAWSPDLTASHLARAALTGYAALPGGAAGEVRLPGLHRRSPSAALCADPARPERLTLCWPAPPAPPPRPEPAPADASVPPALLEWLARPLPGALRAAAAWLAEGGAGVRVRLFDGRRLHTARANWDGPGADGSPPPRLLLDGDQPCGRIECRGATDPGREEATALVLTLVSRQAREREDSGRRTRCARLGAELQGHLLALGGRGELLPDVPLHTAMRLLGASGGALVTLDDSGGVDCPATSGTLAAPGADLFLRPGLLRRLAVSRGPAPYLLPGPDLAGAARVLLVLPLAGAAGRRGAWVFVDPGRPHWPTPEGWAALRAVAAHPALLQSLGPLPEPPGPGGGLAAAGLLRSLGESDFPLVLAERGLSHLVGRDGAQAGAYLSTRGGPDTPPGPGGVSALVQVGGTEEVPPDLARRVAGSGEPLSLTAPDPRLPAPLTSALLAPVRASGRTTGVLALLDRRPGAHPAPETPGLLALLAGRVGGASERQTTLHDLARIREGVFRVLGKVLEYRSYETGGHTDRVTGLALRLGTHLDLDYGQLSHLRWGAYLHDLGKIAIPDAVLLKRGPLTLTERELMRGHVTIGEFILREQGFVPAEVLGVVRHHHERWDGLGYPDGLSGEQIPLLARLFTIADVYDALTSERPYKPSWSHEDALAELRRMAGTHLDPELLAAFLTLPPLPGGEGELDPGVHLA